MLNRLCNFWTPPDSNWTNKARRHSYISSQNTSISSHKFGRNVGLENLSVCFSYSRSIDTRISYLSVTQGNKICNVKYFLLLAYWCLLCSTIQSRITSPSLELESSRLGEVLLNCIPDYVNTLKFHEKCFKSQRYCSVSLEN